MTMNEAKEIALKALVYIAGNDEVDPGARIRAAVEILYQRSDPAPSSDEENPF